MMLVFNKNVVLEKAKVS